jgi:hypothetical protein
MPCAAGNAGSIRLPMYRPSFANFVACFLPPIDFKNDRPRSEARILNVDFVKWSLLKMSVTEVFQRASGNKFTTHLLMFCGACALVWVLGATYGLDLSPGFF